MIRHNARKKKIQRKKVAFIASITRAKTVKNTNKSISPVVHHKTVETGIPPDKIITNPFTGHVFVMTNPHRITGNKYGVSIVTYDWVPKNKYKAHPQPTKRYTKHTSPPKMNRVFYMEKLVQYKLSKWMTAHPCPATMFAEQVEEWNEKKLSTEERMRDFVISAYTKLPLMARFKISEGKYTPNYSIKVGELKDKHHELVGGINPVQLDPKKSPLMKKAKQITNSIHAKHANLVAVNLLDHMHKKGCLILPDKKLAA